MTKEREALKLARELVQRFVDCDGISSSDYLDVRAAIDESLAQPQTVNQFHPDYADEAINEMTLTIQRQSQRIEELEQEASGQYMTGYEVARSEFQQRIQELEAQGAQPEQEPVAQWLEDAFREGWAACRDAEFVGEDEEDWKFGNSTANSRMIDLQQTTPPYVATPRPQRTWVDLTDEEVVQCQQGNIYHFYRCIEAKLKEKNNG